MQEKQCQKWENENSKNIYEICHFKQVQYL